MGFVLWLLQSHSLTVASKLPAQNRKIKMRIDNNKKSVSKTTRGVLEDEKKNVYPIADGQASMPIERKKFWNIPFFFIALDDIIEILKRNLRTKKNSLRTMENDRNEKSSSL
jgi:hypothetical protein